MLLDSFRSTCWPRPRRGTCWPRGSVRTGWPPSPTRSTTSSSCAPGCPSRSRWRPRTRPCGRTFRWPASGPPGRPRRLVDHYLHTAVGATLVDPHPRDPIEIAPMSPGVTPEPIADHRAAMAWFATERPLMAPIVGLAAENRLDAQAWQLAWAAANFLYRQGDWRGFVGTPGGAPDPAGPAGDAPRQPAPGPFLRGAPGRVGRDDPAC